jgi:phage shock protein C
MEKRLVKSRKEKMIAGVAGGIAEYFDIDPVLVRVAFVLLTFLHGGGILAYVILWIVMPAAKVLPVFATPAAPGVTDVSEPVPNDPEIETRQPSAAGTSKSGMIAGSILIGLGTLFLLDNLIPDIDFEELWPLVLIILGGGLLWNSLKRDS